MMGHGAAGLLIAAATGYWVFERASSRKEPVKRIGQWVGGAIMVVSLIGVACRVWSVVACTTGLCPFGKSGKTISCPFSPSSSSQRMSPVTPEPGRR